MDTNTDKKSILHYWNQLPTEIFDMVLQLTKVKCFSCRKEDYYHNFFKKAKFKRRKNSDKPIYFCSVDCYYQLFLTFNGFSYYNF